jgi:Glycosyl transferase family 2
MRLRRPAPADSMTGRSDMESGIYVPDREREANGSEPDVLRIPEAATMTEHADADTDISVVIPCLNEEASIEHCVRQALAAIRDAGLTGEVVVVDNGSTDRSPELAQAAGARVVREDRKGYGRAYLRGFREARGALIFMGDADGTYNFGELPRFLDKMTGDVEFVMGSRLQGDIQPGALIWWRRFGNFLLSGMLRLVFRPGITDAHCGLRLISRSAVERMPLAAPGMEFASEMIILAKRQGVRMAEVPIEYATRPEDSPSKLKSIPDGLRHVRYMLAHAPAAWFFVPAGVLTGVGTGLLVVAHARGAAAVSGAVILALAALVVQGWYGLRLYARLAHGSGGPDPVPAWLRFGRPVAAVLGLACIGIIVAIVAGGGGGSLGTADGTGTLLAIDVAIVILSSVVWVASLQRVLGRNPPR